MRKKKPKVTDNVGIKMVADTIKTLEAIAQAKGLESV
jgi:hypothetical protein